MISRDEWLEALRDVTAPLEENSDAIMVREFAEILGVSHGQAGRKMRQLVASNRAVQVRRQLRRSDGGVIYVPAYRLIKASD